MSVTDEVLEILARDPQKTLSGEMIAQQLQISRNAVWKAVNTLKKQGFHITASTNSGYCFCDDVVTRRGMQACLPDLEVRILNSVSSTNSYLKAEAETNREGLVIVARRQTGGRGRMGRSFSSPPNTGLYMSLFLRPAMQAEEAVRITTMAAVAVCRAIEAFTEQKAEIKWVNDVFLAGKKVCGILTEASVNVENGRIEYAILGIGVNLYEPEGGFAAEIKGVAGAVFGEKTGHYADRFACEILRQFFSFYHGQPYIEEYRARSLLTGREIVYSMQGEERRATVVGVDDNGGLIVRNTVGELSVLRSGEVSVRYDKGEIKNG